MPWYFGCVADKMNKDKIRAVFAAAGEDASENCIVQSVGDDWIAIMEWPEGAEDGGPSRLTMKPLRKMPVGGLSSTVLRQVDFKAAIELFRDQRVASRQHGKVNPEDLRAFERSRLRAALSEGVTDQYLAMLSFEYVRAVDRGQANINDYLAELVGRPVGTVRGHLIRARRDGLLSGTHGRKGGELSPQADDLVEPYAHAWLEEFDRLAGHSSDGDGTLETIQPVLRAVEDKPTRRRPQKAITPRTAT